MHADASFVDSNRKQALKGTRASMDKLIETAVHGICFRLPGRMAARRCDAQDCAKRFHSVDETTIVGNEIVIV